MRTSIVILVCAMAFVVTSPAWGEFVTNGLIGLHDANTYSGTGPLNDSVTSDGYDATGTLESSITHTAPAGGDPGFFTNFENGGNGQITFDVGPTTIGSGDFTFSVWVNKSSGGQNAHLGFIGSPTENATPMAPEGNGIAIFQVRSGDANSPNGFRTPITQGGDYQDSDTANAYVPANSGAREVPADLFNNTTPLFDGTWHLFTLTRSGCDVTAYFDTDNATHPENATCPGAHAIVDISGAATPLHVNGHSNSGRILRSEDKINKVLLWDRVLSPAEIAQNVAAGPGAVIPEPASLALLGLGGLLMVMFRRRRNR